MSQPKFTVTADFTQDFADIIRGLKKGEVLVGIPETTTERKKEEDEGPINNATLLAINNFGSPKNNIPARPVMQIGIRNAQPEIIEQFRLGAIRALSQGIAAISPTLNRVGIIASNSVKKAINAQEGFDPPSDATLRARKSHGFKGEKALIVTGQMRNAITYVVRGQG